MCKVGQPLTPFPLLATLPSHRGAARAFPLVTPSHPVCEMSGWPTPTQHSLCSTHYSAQGSLGLSWDSSRFSEWTLGRSLLDRDVP